MGFTEGFNVESSTWLTLAASIMLALAIYIVVSMLLSISMEDFMKALSSSETLFAIKLSFATAIPSSIVALTISIPLAYALARCRFKLRTALDVLVASPMSMSPIALGTLILFTLLKVPPGRALNDSLNIVYDVKGIVLVQTLIATSVMTTSLKGVFSSLDIDYEELSIALGHSWFSTLVNVVIPMSKRGLLASYLMGFLRAFTDFGATVMVAGATLFKTSTLPTAIYIAMGSGDFALAIALVSLSMIIGVAVVAVINSLWREPIDASY